MEFGFWKKNSFSELEYTSISALLQEPMLEDEEFWNIVMLNDWVLFQSLDRIYSHNLKTKTFKILNIKSTKAQIFKVDDTVYFQNQNLGIYKIEDGTPVLVLGPIGLGGRNVVGIYREDSDLLVILDNAQMIKTRGDDTSPVQVKVAKDIKGSTIYGTERLRDGSFILGTISRGIYHISKEGKLLNNIDQRKGLNNNTVLSIFQDRDDNLWLGLDNGLSIINMNSRFKEYQDNLGRLGLVYVSQLHDEYLYLGTNQGLFAKVRNVDEDFKMIPDTDGQVWSLDVVDGTLFCGHNKGTFVVAKEEATLISELPGTWGVKESKKDTTVLIQGNYDGISTLQKKNGRWEFGNIISGFETSSRFFEVLDTKNILVNHEYKGLFELTIDESYTKVMGTKTHSIMGHGSSLANFQGDIIYTSLDGAFRKRKDSLVFEPDSTLNSLFFENAGGINSILLPDDNTLRLWCFTKNGLSYIYPDTFNATLSLKTIPIPDFFRRSLGVSGFENLKQIENELYLIGISNGFVILDTKQQENYTYEVGLRTVSSSDSFNKITKMDMAPGQNLKYETNNVHFEYSVPQYDKYTEVRYQYRLFGLLEEWGPWSTSASATFNSLDFGDYRFEVRARVGNTMSRNVARYNFTVNRPWYLSILAIALYILGLVALSISIHKLYKSYYTNKQNRLLKLEKRKLKRKKLKTEKELIQLKNEKLQTEFNSKSRELAISTMSMVKKNQFLNAIKEELNKEERSPHIKSIIKTINRNIEDEDDWKFFEEAFNNADKDFLRTLQEKHAELTPNDLKLCAYLRLNLTTKEIAPLLNISVKSVEVKRYRLRKKMNLEHKDGLTDYILSV
ncbi:MAG: LuxR C-terminal-related transcriptional regulator [Maribacter sp.]